MDKQSSLTAEQWQEHVTAWHASGLGQADYCKAHGLAAKSFWYWKRKLHDAPAQVTGSPPGPFIPIKVVDEKPVQVAPQESASVVTQSLVSAISLHVGKAYRIDLLPGFDPVTLRQAIIVLQG